MPTTDRLLRDGPETVVKVILKSWTCPLRAQPDPARIELQLGTAQENTDMFADLTPGQARAVASALLEIADTAEQADA